MLTTTESSRQLDRLGTAIRAYKVASGRTLAFAMIKTGRELAFALHAETKKVTPSKQKLLDLGPALGWRVKRKKGSVAAELARRVRSRFFHSLGWLPSKKGFVRKDVVTSVANKYGALIAAVEMNGTVHIQLINRTGQIEKVSNRHSILQKAVDRVRGGMLPYIKTKLGEEAGKAFSQI